jgi:uncharacterized protein YegL
VNKAKEPDGNRAGQYRIPLIVKSEPVSRGRPGANGLHDVSLAAVYADAKGKLVCLGRALNWRELLMGRYVIRYDVDVRDHEFRIDLDKALLPARGDLYQFSGTVEVGFRVTDPVTVVRRQIGDGMTVVFTRLHDGLRRASRAFDIEDSARAEAAINEMFAGPVPLDEGITVYRCSARLAPDQRAREYLEKRRNADRQLEVGQAEHRVNIKATHYDLELSTLRHNAEIDHRKRELQELSGADLDHRRLLFLHLAEHPEDTETVLAYLNRYEDKQFERAAEREQRRIDVIQFMIENKLVHAVDVDKVIAEAVEDLRRPSPLEASIDDVASLPGSTASVRVPDGTEITGSITEITTVVDVPPNVRDGVTVASRSELLLVYVAIEESALAKPWVDDIARGAEELYRTLRADKATVDRVHLSLLGFAEDVSVHLTTGSTGEPSPIGPFLPRAAASYAVLFADLAERLAADVDRLTASGEVVRRPMVFVLTSGRHAGDDWSSARERLLWGAMSPGHVPDIAVFGVGPVNADVVAGIATRRDLAFVTSRGVAVGTAIRRFFTAVASSVRRVAGAAESAPIGDFVAAPDGFVRGAAA